MNRRTPRTLVGMIAAAITLAACSATGSHNLTCTSTEIAPNTQPGSAKPGAALRWYLENGDSGLPRKGFELTGNSKTRYVYSDGSNQVSVGALPAEKGQGPTWVVLMTYDCD